MTADRNRKIHVLFSDGLLHPHDGAFLYPGTLEPDGTYRPMADKNIADPAVYKKQLVYLDDKAVLSNTWAGKLFSEHRMPEAKLFAGGEDFTFLIADGRDLKLLNDREELWKGKTSEAVIELKYAPATEKLLIHLKFKNNNHEKNRYMFNFFCAGTYSRSTEFI